MTRIWLPAVLALAGVAGCGGDDGAGGQGGEGGGASDSAVTFHRDVEPLLHQHCLSCHTKGQIGGFSLETFEDASVQAGVMAANVEARIMPPFLAQDTEQCSVRFGFRDDPSLTDEEIATFRGWADAGAPEGDPADAPPKFVLEAPGLPDADLEIQAPVTTTVNGTSDVFLCVVYDPALDGPTWFDGIHFVAGNPSVDHHAILGRTTRDSLPAGALDAGSYDCFGSPGEMITGWAPGGVPLELPEGAAIQLGPDDVIVVQMHYHPAGVEAEDRSTIQLRQAAGTPTYEYRSFLWGNASNAEQGLLPGPDDGDAPEFLIPAGAKNHTEEMTLVVPAAVPIPLKILGVATHMHYVGADMRIEIERPDGGNGQPADECMLETPNWDFGWQRAYLYDTDFDSLPTIEAGDTLRLTCRYDNSLSHAGTKKALEEQGLSMPVDMTIGESTLDEMCIGAFGILAPVF